MRTKMLVLFTAPKSTPCTICRFAYEMPSHQLSRIGLHQFMSYNLQTQHNTSHTSERNSFTKSAQFSCIPNQNFSVKLKNTTREQVCLWSLRCRVYFGRVTYFIRSIRTSRTNTQCTSADWYLHVLQVISCFRQPQDRKLTCKNCTILVVVKNGTMP
jgi:hypothetical protein